MIESGRYYIVRIVVSDALMGGCCIIPEGTTTGAFVAIYASFRAWILGQYSGTGAGVIRVNLN